MNGWINQLSADELTFLPNGQIFFQRATNSLCGSAKSVPDRVRNRGLLYRLKTLFLSLISSAKIGRRFEGDGLLQLLQESLVRVFAQSSRLALSCPLLLLHHDVDSLSLSTKRNRFDETAWRVQ